jgi:hypothetical protein
MLLETIGYNATAPSTGAAAAAFTGDSLQVKNGAPGKLIWLIHAWGLNQTAGSHQITHPTGNDTTRGIRSQVQAAAESVIIPPSRLHRIVEQELLAITIVGSAVAGDIEQGCITLLYEDLPGQYGRYIDPAELLDRCRRLVTVEATISTGTAGGWSGAEALNAESDLLRPNRDYAVLGMANRVQCLAIGIRSPDWSNARIAIPGYIASPTRWANYFSDLSYAIDRPAIPVLNSGNKASIQIDAAVDENGADPIISIFLAELF